MIEGHDRRLLYQDPIRSPVQLHPLLLIHNPPGFLYQPIVGFVLPVGQIPEAVGPEEIVRIGIVGVPTHKEHGRWLSAQPVEKHSPLPCFPRYLYFYLQVLPPLRPQVLASRFMDPAR